VVRAVGPLRFYREEEGLGVRAIFFSHQADFIFGGEVVTLAFMRELKRVGVEVHFASPPGPYHDRAKDAATTCHLVSSMQFSRSISLLPKLGGALLSTHQDLAAIVRRHSIDVLHATSLKAMAYAWSLGSVVPVIWHHHDILPATKANNLWARGLAARAALILCPSEATRSSLTAAGVSAGKAKVLRNGFRTGEWSSRATRLDGAPLQLGFIGELSHRKGVDRLPVILDKLSGLGEVKLTVAGEGLSDPAFAARVKSELVARGATLLGQVKDTRPLYSSLDLLLVPSRQDPLPTVIVEAGLSGVPVVGARAGGIPEMILDGRNGFLFDTEEQAAIAVGRVMERWRELAAGAREIAVELYDIEKLTRQLISHYQEAVGGA
jgi:glycosyltransferase involved in cell wall biosynthesis